MHLSEMAVEEENVEDRCTTGKIKRRVFEKKIKGYKSKNKVTENPEHIRRRERYVPGFLV